MSLTLYIVRHGERMDHVEPSFLYTSPTPFDPPLTPKGKRQAKTTGSFVHTLQQESISNDTKRNVEYVITTSPFARTSETAIGIAEGIASSDPNSKIKFRVDSSLAEWHTSAYYAQAVPNSIISKRFEEIHERNGKDDNSSYPFEVDFSYTPVLNELPKYPEGIHEVLKRCQKALAGMSSPFIQQIKQDKLSEDTEKSDTHKVLIFVTHGWCFNVIQEACSKGSGWKEAGFCAVSRAKWIPKEDSEEEGVRIPDITVSITDEEDSEKSEIERKNEEAINSLTAVNPDGKWIVDVSAHTEHIKGI
ncbi:histidine phosphatase superfamily [Glomus cerebriforme]|uniref:Histidine phosphatase superfamily n=1 Tax=Glomus cerebriforme TaxID=658196 RepID=A0A397SEG9_9GLOM|nr:histidine phosphatase superfamily [Glomus cerebriforme]